MTAANFNPIPLQKETRPARMLTRDSSGELVETTVPLEFRTDPLTGRTIRLVQFNLDKVIRPDLNALEQQSREMFCPFCPPVVEQITPKFTPDLVPDGNICTGEAYAFPNNGPYDVYGAVVVMSRE
ncbi:MAG: hypothetical protein MUO19_01435, partial [Dehalococcoidales bacterium]|nr:hypothetical protein [Dehalococcoidales bacterium]